MGHYPRIALLELSKGHNPYHHAVRFPQPGQILVLTLADADRLFSSALVDRLRLLPDRPWSGSNNGGKPMTEARLARQLGVFGVFSRKIVIGEHRAKEYTIGDFAKAFAGLEARPDEAEKWGGQLK